MNHEAQADKARQISDNNLIDGILPGTTLSHGQLTRLATRGTSQCGVDDEAEIKRLLPPMSIHASHEVYRLILRLTPGTRDEFIRALESLKA